MVSSQSAALVPSVAAFSASGFSVADIRLGVSYAEFNMVTSDTLVRAFLGFLASERLSDTRA